MLMWGLIHANAQKLIPAGEAYGGTSVNATVFRSNSIATHKRTQYIAYYDNEGYIVVGKRKLGSRKWTLRKSAYRGRIEDAHNAISIMVDTEGYLHVAFDHHGHPLNYCRSVAPGSLVLGPKEQMIGRDEADVTYPEFYALPDGDLIFVYRSGRSGRGNLVMNRYDLKARRWTRVQDVLIDGEQQRNAYWQLSVDGRGVIHLSWVWRESWLVETNHDLCYARSADGGKTWSRSTGEPYELPLRKDNAEYACRIPMNSELINQTGMSADDEGRPYIAAYWRSADSDVPQYRIVWHDGADWHTAQVSNRKTPFSLKGGGTKRIPIARPRIAVDGKEVYYFFRDEERGGKVSVSRTSDLSSGMWSTHDLTDFSVHAWEPSFDTELWRQRRLLHLYVQVVFQGDGEQAMEADPQPVYVLEVNRNP